MNLTNHFILIDNTPCTSKIESICRNGTNHYAVRFKERETAYNYGCDRITWLSDPKWKDPSHCKVTHRGRQLNDIREIWEFKQSSASWWRIIGKSGYTIESDSKDIVVETSCLGEPEAQNTLAYLRKVASINTLGKDDESDGIVSNIYERINFLDDTLAAACYLNPQDHKPKTMTHGHMIFPFGCNASQKKAVTNAFKHQISVIQGPPGTGKTQTILNIIANIVSQGQTVMVVSNNNAATTNVLEKLDTYGIGFIVAALGNNQNKKNFVDNQPPIPTDCATWALPSVETTKLKMRLDEVSRELDTIYDLQNKRAKLLQEQHSVTLEWKHFCLDNHTDEDPAMGSTTNSKRVIAMWVELQSYANSDDTTASNWWQKIVGSLKWWWIKLICQYLLHIKCEIRRQDPTQAIKQLQALYYRSRLREIAQLIGTIEEQLASHDAKTLSQELNDISMALFRSSLHAHYQNTPRSVFTDTDDMKRRGDELKRQYPVVLSTTISAHFCIYNNRPYDYVIMDEASQVASETGLLALTCANNAVIVGDTRQLPNVVTTQDQIKLKAIMEHYNVDEGYDCAKYSFLESVTSIIAGVTTTMLREHYRCHPRIINFCNQKYYDGNLLIMTEDHDEQNVLSAFLTPEGNHATNQYNQREIDVVKSEVLPTLDSTENTGIIAPYNNQVNQFARQLPCITSGTIHKFQGREKDTIIMSVVDNQISPFTDDAKMLNVAVSRAKNKFCLVMTGNKQPQHGNIMDLLDYIAYNNCTVTKSKLASIFDYLYEQYTDQRMAFLESHPKISQYASENLTYGLINDILQSDPAYQGMKVLCHIPLCQVIKGTALMTAEERRYASNYNTHLDFVIINSVIKRPLIAIETDGYTYHNVGTKQHHRDQMKNHILATYGLPLLRLSTKGSGERTKIIDKLSLIVDKT